MSSSDHTLCYQAVETLFSNSAARENQQGTLQQADAQAHSRAMKSEFPGMGPRQE